MLRVYICNGNVGEFFEAHTETLSFRVYSEDEVLALMQYATANGYVMAVEFVEEDGGEEP